MVIKKLFLIALGFVSLGLGVVGIILPLLPTTPLVLLSAGCFGASNKKIEGWLLRSRVFGPFIENYRTRSGISRLHKYGSIAFLWVGLISTIVIMRTGWVFVVLGLVGIGVTTHLLMIRTKKKV